MNFPLTKIIPGRASTDDWKHFKILTSFLNSIMIQVTSLTYSVLLAKSSLNCLHFLKSRMDSEDKVLKLISYDASQESRSEAINYLRKLRSYKKENLKKDSVNLLDDLNNLDLQTQEIAFSNYPAFIKTAESSRQVLKGWNETTKNVESLIDKLPKFSEKCDTFVKTTLEIQSSSRLNSLTMKRHLELLEILELPQLMESSIREEKYEDALELASYVQKLGEKFEKVPVVNVRNDF